MRWAWGLALGLLCACPQGASVTVQQSRSSCLDCHRPIDGQGMAHGIEAMHPPVDGKPLACERCHGGDPTSRALTTAHVQPGIDDARSLRGLSHSELDRVTPAYLRFINPGDLRVADQSCGGECHGQTVEHVRGSPMAIKSGSFAVGRYRAGLQRSPNALRAVRDATNVNFAVGERPGTVGAVAKLDEPRIAGDEDEVSPYYDLMLTKDCGGCHLYRFSDSKAPGAHRSSGCSACHVAYAEDGQSQSGDPQAASTVGHPRQHRFQRAPANEQCISCHQAGGGRIGLSYQGLRQAASPGYRTAGTQPHRGAHYGLGEGALVARESDAAYDATPPDVHFEAGMHCVDCHTEPEVHGDGHITSGGGAALEIACASCHGDGSGPASLTTRRGNPLNHLRRDGDRVILTSKVTGVEHVVPQVAEVIAGAAAGSQLHASMGRSDDGFSHLDSLDCSACHSAWIPTCYGCHVEVDMGRAEMSSVAGNATLGATEASQKYVRTDRLMLALDGHGKIKPSMPSERLFMSAVNGAGERLIDRAVRQTLSQEPGHGHRAIDPHTTRRWSPFMACARCHSGETARLAAGLGSSQFVAPDGDGRMHRLDKIQGEDGEPVVTFGARVERRAGPITMGTMDRMLNPELALPDCDVDASVAMPLSKLRDRILTPHCDGCHDGARAAGLTHTLLSARADLPAVLRAGHHDLVLDACDIAAIEGWLAGGARDD